MRTLFTQRLANSYLAPVHQTLSFPIDVAIDDPDFFSNSSDLRTPSFFDPPASPSFCLFGFWQLDTLNCHASSPARPWSRFVRAWLTKPNLCHQSVIVPVEPRKEADLINLSFLLAWFSPQHLSSWSGPAPPGLDDIPIWAGGDCAACKPHERNWGKNVCLELCACLGFLHCPRRLSSHVK